MKRKNILKNTCIIGESVPDLEDNIEIISLSPSSDIKDGTLISSFSFNDALSPVQASKTEDICVPHLTRTEAENLQDNRKLKTEANIATPSVGSEAYSINRFYKLRYSTAKMLNEIKAAHSDVNVYMNTIVDEAIRHYYSFILKK